MADWQLKTQQQGVYTAGQGLSYYDKLYEGSTPSTGLYVTGPDGKDYVYVPKEFTAKGLEYEGLNDYNKPSGIKTQYYNSTYLDPKTFENAYSFKLPDSVKNSSFITSSDFDGVTNYSDINKSGEGFLFPADYYNTVVNKPGNTGSYKTAYKKDNQGDWIELTKPLQGVGKVNERIAAVNGLDPNQPVYLAGGKQIGDNEARQYFVSPATGGLQEKGIVVNQKNTWFGIGGVIGDVMGGIAQGIRDLGPIGQIGMMYATAGLGEMVGAQLGIGSLAGSAIVNGAMQVAQGKDIEDALTGAAKTIAIGTAAGQVSNSVLGEAAAEKYATDVGSQQTNMLAQQEAGMGTLALNDVLGTGVNLSADLASKVAGQTAGSVLAGNDIMSALTTGGINLGVPMLTAQIPGFDKLDPKLQRAASIVIGNELQGKDPTQALINQAIQIGMDTVKTSGKNLSTNYASNLAAEGIDPNTFDAAELNFGTGSNQLSQEDLANIVNGGIGDATLTGGTGQDTLAGGQDSVTGGEATTQGGAGADTLAGGTDTGTTLTGDDGSTLTIDDKGNVTSTDATDTGSSTLTGGSGAADTITGGTTAQPNVEYYNDGTYKVTYEDGTSAIFNADGTPYSTVDNTGTNNLSIIVDDSSPSGYRDSLGQPVNQDGTPYVAPAKGNDTLTGGQSTTTGGSQSTTTGGQSTVPGGQSTVPGGQSTVPGGGSGGLNLGALLALLGTGQGQQAPTAPPVVDIGEQLDLESPLQTNPFAKKQTQSKMAEGGSIDDLLALLQQRG